MRLIRIAGACVLIAATALSTLASASIARDTLDPEGLGPPAAFPSSPIASTAMSVNPLLAKEIAVLTRQGLSPAHASRAIDVQGRIARAGLLSKIEGRMGSAYAGVWFEPATAQLHVGVASPSDRRVAKGIIARAGLATDVTLVPVRSTWAELLAAQKRWNRRLTRLFARAEVMTALDAHRNGVSITLGSAVTPLERTRIERAASSASVNVFVAIAQQPKLGIKTLAETKCKKFVTKEAYCDKPITAGVRVEATTGCTAGPMAIPTATKVGTYLLTAGHCLQLNGGAKEKWFAFNRAAQRLEVGKAVEFTYALAGDFGDILVDEPGNWVEAGNTPVFAVTARWGLAGAAGEKSYPVIGKEEPAEKMPNCHEGQASGESCGTVGVTSVTVIVEDKVGEEVKIEGLVEDKGANAEGGDSGGPWVFINKANEIFMEGTLVGGEEGNKVKIFYEPLKTIFKELKPELELLTTSNENRTKGKPLLLPEPTAESPIAFTGKLGKVVVETKAGTKVECTSGEDSGSFTKAKLGTFETVYHGCKSTGVACNGLADKAEAISVKGDIHLWYGFLAKEKGLHTTVTALLKEAHFTCGGLVLIVLKGCLAGLVKPTNKKTKATTVEMTQEKGVNDITEVLNDNSEKTSCKLEAAKSEGAFEQAGGQMSEEGEKFKQGGKEIEVEAMA